MADGRKFRYDSQSDWTTFSATVPIIHASTLEKALQDIVGKGLYKFTIKNYHTKTAELWFDTTYNTKVVTEAIKDVPGIKYKKL